MNTMTSPVTALAFAFKNALQDKDTPKVLRDKLARFAAELRDSLTDNIAHMVDGAEAEIVILACAGDAPRTPIPADVLQSPQLLRQTQDGPGAILDDIGE